MKIFYEYLCKFEVLFVEVMFVFLVALVFTAAATRYMGHPINWSVDMAQCLFAWCTFLAADIAMRNDRLMKVDFFLNKLPQDKQYLIEVINLVVILAFLATLIGYGSFLCYTTRFRTFQGIPGFSYTWVTLSVPVGGILMTVTAILRLKALKASRRSGSEADREEVTE